MHSSMQTFWMGAGERGGRSTSGFVIWMVEDDTATFHSPYMWEICEHTRLDSSEFAAPCGTQELDVLSPKPRDFG